VKRIADGEAQGRSRAAIAEETLSFCRAIAGAVHGSRAGAGAA
jgi:hypothetical protein